MKIYVNKNPAGKISNLTFGICQIIDGVLRIFTFGWLASTLTLDHSRKQAGKNIQKLRNGQK